MRGRDRCRRLAGRGHDGYDFLNVVTGLFVDPAGGGR